MRSEAAGEMKRVIVVANVRKRAVRESMERLLAWIRGRADVVLVDMDGDAKLEEVPADLAVAFGGDGTILSVARRLGRNRVPVVGVNFGKFGFLAKLSEEEFLKAFDKILAGNATLRKRLMLEGRLRWTRGEDGHSLALNDFVVVSKDRSRMVALELLIDHEGTTVYEGDGLIVSTPVGSTAHSLSAGGPVVHPDVDAFVITPICPHVLTNRPLVVPASVLVEVRLGGDTSAAEVSVDGQTRWEMRGEDVLEIRSFGRNFALIDTGERTYYETLRSKLRWGGSRSYGPSKGD